MFLMVFANVHWVLMEGCGALTEACGDRRACTYICLDVGMRTSLNVA